MNKLKNKENLKNLKWFISIGFAVILLCISAVTVFAAGDVSTAIQSTWTTAPLYIWSVL